MTNSYTINIDGIGPVLFEKSSRAKRVIISVRTSKDTRVAVPTRTSFKKALEFVYLKKEWIQRHLAKIKQNENRKKAFTDPSLVIDKVDARKRLTDRLYHLAREHGFTCNNVSVREQRTRWGSCSHKNNISLNVKLVLLPKELIDYVMLHELVHTRIHNHSKKFWAELDRYTGNGKVMAKRLRMDDFRLL
ncbi:M48 family metallopeptidase [Chloroflexota bacterium]